MSQVEGAVAAAREAFRRWAGLTHQERRRYLSALRQAVARDAQRIAETVHTETGKAVADALLAEVLPAAQQAAFHARHAERVLAARRVSPRPVYTKRAWTEYRPLGVAAVISPANYPFLLPFLPAVTAIAAGCVAVVKPSEAAPRSGLLVAEIARRAGLPHGVIQVVSGGPDVAARLVSADVDVVSFTGSPEAGRRIAGLAAERLVPVILELGGKDAMVVCDDANLRRAARAAVWGAMFNAGQNCVAVERVYITDGAHDRFVREAADAMDDVAAGTGDARDIGPILSERQLGIIEDHVADAVAKGATVVRGGRRHGRYFEPTVLTGVDHSMAVMRAETFGPVLPIMRVRDETAALDAVNDSPYGLLASVWTNDRTRGRRLARRIRAGGAAVNDCLINFGMPAVPSGGVGRSGYGSNSGSEGLKAFSYPASLTDSRLRLPREPHWFPRRIPAAAVRWWIHWFHGR